MKTTNKTKRKLKNILTLCADVLTKSCQFDDIIDITINEENKTQINYITKKAVKGLKEHTQKDYHSLTKKEQEKAKTKTSLSNLLHKLFNVKVSQENFVGNLQTEYQQSIKKDLELNWFFEKDIGGFYAEDIKEENSKEQKYIYPKTGSCMERKPSRYFEVFEDDIIESHKHIIVGLKNDKKVYARAILWYRDFVGCEFYLDVIYVDEAFRGDNEEQKRLDFELWKQTKKAFKLKSLDCHNKTQIKDYLNDKYKNLIAEKTKEQTAKIDKFVIKEQKKIAEINQQKDLTAEEKSKKITEEETKRTLIPSNCPKVFNMFYNKGFNKYPKFNLDISDEFFNLESYPYFDTFRYVNEDDLSISNDEDNCTHKLEDTAGTLMANARFECADCGDYYESEDELYYSEMQDESYCESCGTYIEERDDYVREVDAIYNNYSGEYHYSGDLDC